MPSRLFGLTPRSRSTRRSCASTPDKPPSRSPPRLGRAEMWLKTVFLKTLRDHRLGALAWSIGPGLLMTATLTQFEQLVGSPEQRGALVALAEQFAWYEAPIGITQPGGFVTFRLNPLLAILPSVWALLAASGQLRGEEERGALDLVLATPTTRTRVVLEKLAALATALVGLARLLGSSGGLAGRTAPVEYSTVGAYVFALNVALTAGVYGAMALLAAQFVSERSSAAGLTGGFLALSFLLLATSRVTPGLEWLAYFSPLYYSGLTKPLVPEVGTNPAAMVMLAGGIGLCAALSAWLFTRRDLGFALRLLPAPAATAPEVTRFVPFAPQGSWSLRTVYLRAVRVGAGSAVWWALGTAGYAAWATGVGRQLQSNMAGVAQASPVLSVIFARMLDPRAGTAIFLSMLVFSFVPLALCALAISLVGRWAADEESGRTDMLLAYPISRPHAILVSFAAIATVLLAVSSALGLAVGVAAAAAGL